jgi:alkanesulfonate monooxygenase SsuD/methylene tetrahydromethanopterin reductase-like flavin-dependent oxidoreductase (luciferase family)
MDRLLAPLTPRTKAYPGSADGLLPAAQDVVFDPLVALTVAATVTDRIGVGTDVLVAPWYSPVLLARRLAALDQVSRGRLVVGLGQGWSIESSKPSGSRWPDEDSASTRCSTS